MRLSTFVALVVFALAVTLAPAQQGNAERLMQASDCSSCHAVDHDVVGPSYHAVAENYAGKAEGVEKISTKIRDGGNGMTPHPDFTDAERREIAQWILSQKDQAGAEASSTAKLYSYTLKDGTKIQLDFPVFVDGSDQKVTKQVFRGYQLWNSYCFRCHGTDATGGQLAPDLRHSLAAGMKEKEFLSVSMSGRPDKGMPSWAGFLTEDDVASLYKYAKGRSVELVGGGRPPSEQD